MGVFSGVTKEFSKNLQIKNSINNWKKAKEKDRKESKEYFDKIREENRTKSKKYFDNIKEENKEKNKKQLDKIIEDKLTELKKKDEDKKQKLNEIKTSLLKEYVGDVINAKEVIKDENKYGVFNKDKPKKFKSMGNKKLISGGKIRLYKDNTPGKIRMNPYMNLRNNYNRSKKGYR